MNIDENHQAFSVLILIKGRKNHLLNVIAAIELSTYIPQEIIIVHMNEACYDISSSLVTKQVSLNTPALLPLAAARNYAARLARSTSLIFLDVDCIPDQTCFEELLLDADIRAITMTDPLYLKHTVGGIDFDLFKNQATPSQVRKDLSYGHSDRYELFWSLGFMISKPVFTFLGGFDESFRGYGGEDTDFAFKARAEHIPLIFSKARVYHQPHPSYDPPLNWLEDIVENARIFYAKWKTWPMEGWLKSFEESGYIARQSNKITIKKLPTKDEILHTQQ